MRKFILSDISLNGLWSTLTKPLLITASTQKPGEGGLGEVSNVQFCNSGSVVRTIWGSRDLVLLIFAGSAAEFALNRAVDWLFFTGKIPRDPIARLFSTVRYAQQTAASGSSPVGTA